MHPGPNNNILEKCYEGLEYEGIGEKEKAKLCYQGAWEKACTDFEKFTAAHYLARIQQDPEKELFWHKLALEHALAAGESTTSSNLSLLYLNIAKSFEKTGDLDAAFEYGTKADSSLQRLSSNGQGKLVASQIKFFIKRIQGNLGH